MDKYVKGYVGVQGLIWTQACGCDSSYPAKIFRHRSSAIKNEDGTITAYGGYAQMIACKLCNIPYRPMLPEETT